jgi:CheY-like chemotaxis protein
MPIMDGPTATQAIRGLGYSYPIFGVTGNALDSDINYFVKCGAHAVLAKPFDFNRFKRLMKDEKQYASV